MRLFVLNVFLFISVSGIAQSNTGPVDSLKKALQTQTAADTNRVWLLIKLTNSTFTSTPDEAMKYADEALQLSEKIPWKKGIALSYRCKGGVEIVRSNYTVALEYFQKALTNDPKESKLFEAIVLNNIGIIYGELKQYDKELANYKKLLAVAIELKNKESETMALGNIGTNYQITGRYDSALYYYTAGLSRAREINNKRLICNILCTLGSAYKETGKYSEAVKYSEESVQLADESGNLYVKAPALNNLGWAHFYLGNFDKAEKYNKLSLVISKELNSVQWQSESWDALYTNYEKQHKTSQALEAYKNYILLRDSATGNEKKQEITRKEIQYQADKKEVLLKAENDAKINRQRIVRNAIIASSAILLLGGIISFLFYKRKRDAVTGQKEAELNAEIRDTEMKALRSQMNPHFIFNSLNSISDYIAKNNTNLADEYLTKFSKLMRLILENSEQKEVSLSQDLKALELYMQLESLRMNSKFSYEIKVDEAIDKDNTLVPPLILQPFVENSIWHGIAKKEGMGKITIHIKKEDDMINCIVEDDGVGRKETSLAGAEEKKSLGMKITCDRITVLNKVKNSNAEVKLSDLQPGTRVEVKLPLELSF
ncbi:MAG: tetratricopeptide repeat protein [Chitinophagaceae bacterium]